jgi:hypothetical protein
MTPVVRVAVSGELFSLWQLSLLLGLLVLLELHLPYNLLERFWGVLPALKVSPLNWLLIANILRGTVVDCSVMR